MKRFVIVVLLFLLVLTFQVTGAGASEGTDEVEVKWKEGAVEYPIVEEPITLSVLYPSHVTQAKDFNDLRVVKVWEEMTNIKIDWILVATGWDEKKNLAFATGDLPDIIMSSVSLSDEESYGSSGDFIALDDLIDKYAPNVKKAYEADIGLKKSATAADGHIYSLGGVVITQTGGVQGTFLNQEWLDNLGLTMPSNVDEYFDVLNAFRDGDPNGNGEQDEIPLATRSLTDFNGSLLPAFGETMGNGKLVNLKDGDTVRFVPTTEGYKAFLMYLNKLWENQLLDNTLFSKTAEEFLADKERMIVGSTSSTISGCDWTKMSMVPSLSSDLQPEAISMGRYDAYRTGQFSITRTNPYPEASMKWADMFFREMDNPVNGMSGVSFWMGQENVDWEWKDSNKETYGAMYDAKGEERSWAYYKQHIGPGWGIYYMRVFSKPAEAPYAQWVADNNMKYMYPTGKVEWNFPNGIRFSTADSERLSILETDLRTYVNEMSAKLVVGDESFANWDKYVKTVEDMKLDEYLDILQKGWDRY